MLKALYVKIGADVDTRPRPGNQPAHSTTLFWIALCLLAHTIAYLISCHTCQR